MCLILTVHLYCCDIKGYFGHLDKTKITTETISIVEDCFCRNKKFSCVVQFCSDCQLHFSIQESLTIANTILFDKYGITDFF